MFQFDLCNTKHQVVEGCQCDLWERAAEQRERFTQWSGYSNLTGILEECGDLLVQLMTQRFRDAWRERERAVRSCYIREKISVKRNPRGEMLTYRPDKLKTYSHFLDHL